MKFGELLKFERTQVPEGFSEDEFKKIEGYTGMKAVSCKCNTCVNMCKTAPCVGTPANMLKIAAAGFTDKIVNTLYAALEKYEIPAVEMITPLYDEDKGQCAFLTDDNICELHDLGLKPTEGKLANCKINQVEEGKYPPTFVVIESWRSEEAQSIREEILMTIMADKIGKLEL